MIGHLQGYWHWRFLVTPHANRRVKFWNSGGCICLPRSASRALSTGILLEVPAVFAGLRQNVRRLATPHNPSRVRRCPYQFSIACGQCYHFEATVESNIPLLWCVPLSRGPRAHDATQFHYMSISQNHDNMILVAVPMQAMQPGDTFRKVVAGVRNDDILSSASSFAQKTLLLSLQLLPQRRISLTPNTA